MGLAGAVTLIAACAPLGEETDTAAQAVTTQTVEAETLTAASGAPIVRSDNAASGGQALVFYSNGRAARNVTTGALSQLTVRARGDQCNGAPRMVVTLDGTQVLDRYVSNTTYASFSVSVARPAGTHSVSVAFTNDARTSTCDRNLRVDRFDFTTPTPITDAGTDARPDTGTDAGTDSGVVRCGTAICAEGYYCCNPFLNHCTLVGNFCGA